MGTKTGEVEIRATPQALRRAAVWLRRWAPRKFGGLLAGGLQHPTLALSRRLFGLSLDRRRRRAVLTRDEAAAIVRLIAGTREARIIMRLPCPAIPEDVEQFVESCRKAVASRPGRPRLSRERLEERTRPEAWTGFNDESQIWRLRARRKRLIAADLYVESILAGGGPLLTPRNVDPP